MTKYLKKIRDVLPGTVVQPFHSRSFVVLVVFPVHLVFQTRLVGLVLVEAVITNKVYAYTIEDDELALELTGSRMHQRVIWKVAM